MSRIWSHQDQIQRVVVDSFYSPSDAFVRNALAQAVHLIAIQRLLTPGSLHQAERLSQFDEMARPGIGNGNLAAAAEGPRHFAEILGGENTDQEIHGAAAYRPFAQRSATTKPRAL